MKGGNAMVMVFQSILLVLAAGSAGAEEIQVSRQRYQAQSARDQAMQKLMAEAQAAADDVEPLPIQPNPNVKVEDLSVKGHIEGENITFTLACTIEALRRRQEMVLVAGDVVLQETGEENRGVEIRYDASRHAYSAYMPSYGKRKIDLDFAARPRVLGDGPWYEATFSIPSANMRQLELVCDRKDLEVLFPGAMRLERKVEDETLTVTAVMGPGRPFTVRWKPQVQELEAELVFASEANTIVSAETGVLRLSSLFVFDISQGKMRDLSFALPKTLNVTQVRGAFIRDWSIVEGDEAKTLNVSLTRSQVKQYALEVLAEMPVPALPAQIDLPMVEPQGGIRSGGYLAIGTDIAIRLVAERTGGLSQIDASAFPRIVLDRRNPRPLPRGKAFFYMYATTPYQMNLSLSDIVPAFDVTDRVAINVTEEDLTLAVELELDVRDAPIRSLVVEAPKEYMVSNVEGALVEDHTVRMGATQEIEIHFRQPLIGRSLVKLRLELGKSPLGEAQKVEKLAVQGAKNERGYIAIGADQGVQLDVPKTEGLREVHTGSIPMRISNAQFAYRFREKGWSLEMPAREKPAGIRAEAFHLVSLGEGVLYGSVVVTYFITGAPVDELHFRVPEKLQNVEFVSRDVRRWSNEGERWTVQLQRKVNCDYNLLVTYTQHYGDGDGVLVGAVQCEGVDTQTGYITVASKLNLALRKAGPADLSLLDIDRDEVPWNYRHLVNAPILRTYKYVNAPHRVTLEVNPYDRGSLLPAVVDITDMKTTLSVRKDGQAESITRIRYKVKNLSSQFLSLRMPEGARVWSTHIVRDYFRNGQYVQTPVRVAASYDDQNGRLMIPLQRKRNPNEPVTIDVEYAEDHGSLGWSGSLALTAPVTCDGIRTTYTSWTVSAPRERAIVPLAGVMVPEEHDVVLSGFGAVMSGVLRAYGISLRWWGSLGWLLLVVVVPGLLVVVGVAAFLMREGKPVAAALSSLAIIWLAVGLAAAPSLGVRTPPAREVAATDVTFTQILSADENEPLTIRAGLVPVWRRDLTLAGGILLPLLAIAALITAASRRERRAPLVAAGVVGILYGAAQYPGANVVVGHLIAWGIPLVILVRFLVGAAAARLSLRPLSSTAALLLGVLIAVGCAPAASALEENPTLEKVECHLKAEKDSMAVDLKFTIDSRDTVRFPVLYGSAVLLTPEKSSGRSPFEVKEKNGTYYLETLRRGRQEIALKFLAPLPEAQEDQVRQFRMPLPISVTNLVSLEVPETEMEIEAPSAVVLNKETLEKSTRATAVLGPGDDVFFVWKPRARKVSLEKTSFFAELSSLVLFDTGLVECRHLLRYQIAQGEMKSTRVEIPEGMTVTAVEGNELGAWRFDPASRLLEVHLAKPVSGEYALSVVTQISREQLPYTVDIGMPKVTDAVRQRGIVGLAASESVFISVSKHPQAMNVDDFVRDTAGLLQAACTVKSESVRHAFRYHRADETLTVDVGEVEPEIRSSENASFSVGDERLQYNGEVSISVAKAGVFSANLNLPVGYDIDELSAPEVSHWDDKPEGNARSVQVHFKGKLLGNVNLKLAMSKAVSALPQRIPVPRVEVVGALKHTGRIIVSSGQGIRLSVAERVGASEINPLELGIRTQGNLVFKLLQPDWQLDLRTEVVEPRVVVDFLHVAEVTEGLVRHWNYLRYDLHNAGKKVFEIQAPKGAMAFEIVGSDIAHIREVQPDSGLWRVELNRKHFGKGYQFTIRFETQFDRAAGEVHLLPAKAVGADLQSGHVVVRSSDKVELSVVSDERPLQGAESRGISMEFGAGDLSDAAFCYSSPTPDYELVLDARRHEAADLLQAVVREVSITTVANEYGESVNHVALLLMVGGKRYLETRLPAGATMWTLMVNDRSEVPSLKPADGDGQVLLIPLGQAVSGELPVVVEFAYVMPAPPQWKAAEPKFEGPRFDLPLRDVTWTLYMPKNRVYSRFEGTLMPHKETMGAQARGYDMASYDLEIRKTEQRREEKARRFIAQGNDLAEKGYQHQAKQVLEAAVANALSDQSLYEDARVQLHRLNKEQAIVGLVGRRGEVRPKVGEGLLPQGAVRDLGGRFTRDEAERLQNSLSKDDNDNLTLITDNIIKQQDAAAGSNWSLDVKVAPRGKRLIFQRRLQVKPDSEMTVSFRARPERSLAWLSSWSTLALIFLLTLALIRREGAVEKARHSARAEEA